MQRGSEGKRNRRHNRGYNACSNFAVKRPIDEDVWRGDVELGWPWA